VVLQAQETDIKVKKEERGRRKEERGKRKEERGKWKEEGGKRIVISKK
jgi:hypothetical protein